jgi:hypothetical protein
LALGAALGALRFGTGEGGGGEGGGGSFLGRPRFLGAATGAGASSFISSGFNSSFSGFISGFNSGFNSSIGFISFSEKSSSFKSSECCMGTSSI